MDKQPSKFWPKSLRKAGQTAFVRLAKQTSKGWSNSLVCHSVNQGQTALKTLVKQSSKQTASEGKTVFENLVNKTFRCVSNSPRKAGQKSSEKLLKQPPKSWTKVCERLAKNLWKLLNILRKAGQTAFECWLNMLQRASRKAFETLDNKPSKDWQNSLESC